MPKKVNFADVQAMFELCTQPTDLKEFCHDCGVNYDKFVSWQRRQLWDDKLGKSVEKQDPLMRPVEVTDIPDAPVELATAKTPSSPEVQGPSIRFVLLKLRDGLQIKKYDVTPQELVQFLISINGVLC